MESICPICKKPYDGVVCSQCTVTDLDVSGLMASEGLQVQSENLDDAATAFLVDLVSNRKIPITTPRCKVGRDDLNDIVISGDQSISRFHFVITKEANQYFVQDGKSRHGTFLNGNQITAPEPIHDGDVLKVGVSLFWFVIETASSSAEPDRAAPVDLEVMDQQELEFMVPEPVSSVQPVASNASETATVKASETETSPRVQPLKSKKTDTPETSKKEKSESAKRQVEPVTAESKEEPEKTAVKAEATPTALAESQEESTTSNIDKTDAATPKEGISEDSFSVDPAESTQSSLLNSISDSLKAERKSEMIIGADEEFSIGSFTFFEQLTEAPKEDAAEPSSNTTETEQFEIVSAQPGHSEIGQAELKPEAEPVEGQQIKPDIEPAGTPKAEKSDTTSARGAEKAASSAIEPVESISSQETAKVTNEPAESTGNQPPRAEAEKRTEKEEESSATLDKFAEIVGEANPPADKKNGEEVVALSKVLSEFQPAKPAESEIKEESSAEQKPSISDKQPSSNGAKSVMTIVKEPTGQVPDWCKRYFSDELSNLSKELTDLNEQVRAAQQKIKDVEGRVALTKGLRNTLLIAQGEELVEACGKVLTLLGWRVKVSDDDKHELRLDTEDKNICIARIVWTETQADRTHLGQLSISQTRYWCEQGIEPKGILIISKSNDSGPATLGSSDFNSELAEYATKKNVCLMTTLQLLAVYKDIALHNGAPEDVRATILASNGWLSGFALEPGDFAEKEEPTNKLSSLLSA